MSTHPSLLIDHREAAAPAERMPVRVARPLSLLDLLLLFVGFGLGAIVTPWVVMISQEAAASTGPPAPVWQAVYRLTTFIVAGGVCNGPLILLAHRLLGGWRQLSLGETLWLAPLGLLAGFVLAWIFASLTAFLALCVLVLAASVLGLLNAAANLIGFNEDVPCRWTDLFGSFSSCSMLGWLALDLYLYPVM